VRPQPVNRNRQFVFNSRRLHHSTRTFRTLAHGALSGDSAVSQSKGTMSGGSAGRPANPSCVYILRCADNSLYVGSNTDVAARETAHHDGRGAKYAAGRRPVRVVCSESHEPRSTAQKRAYQLKHRTPWEEGSA
jgi:putative endonuclease